MVEIVPRVREWLLSERRIQKDNPSQVPCQVPLMLEGALATARQGVPTETGGHVRAARRMPTSTTPQLRRECVDIVIVGGEGRCHRGARARRRQARETERFHFTVVHPYTHEQQHQVLTTKCRVPLPSLEALDPTGLDALSILFSALGMQQSESLLKSDGDTRGGRQRHPTVTPPHLLCKQASMSRSSTSSGNFMLYLFSHSSSKTNRWVATLNMK